MNEREIFNTIVAAACSALTYILGAWDEPLKILIILMVIDYITGVMAGVIQNKLNSHIGFNGILRKSTILLVLIVAVLLDRLINQSAWVFRTVVAYFYIGNEGISILENCGKCGLPLPKRLMKALEQLKKKEEV
jgi:toxin secretion/phage lysis holin